MRPPSAVTPTGEAIYWVEIPLVATPRVQNGKSDIVRGERRLASLSHLYNR